MPIFFNSILESNMIAPKDVRLLRHKDTRADKGKTPFELWRANEADFESYQATQTIDNRAKLAGKYWASFVGTPNGDTLFVGLYLIKGKNVIDVDRPRLHMSGLDLAGTCDRYDIERLENFSEYAGKLTIEWGLGERAWIQKASNQNKKVVELKKVFSEPDFPGFLYFICSLSKLEALPDTWIEALKSVKGVYLLVCPQTKEQYVGSATGINGFWGRWLEYAKNGHGGDIALKSRDPSDYTVSILEVAGSGIDDNEVLAKESLWKQKLLSKEMGLNRN